MAATARSSFGDRPHVNLDNGPGGAAAEDAAPMTAIQVTALTARLPVRALDDRDAVLVSEGGELVHVAGLPYRWVLQRLLEPKG